MVSRLHMSGTTDSSEQAMIMPTDLELPKPLSDRWSLRFYILTWFETD